MMGKRCCAWFVVVLTEENVCEESLTVAKTTRVKVFDLRNWGSVACSKKPNHPPDEPGGILFKGLGRRCM
jgi:hypothetical protein